MEPKYYLVDGIVYKRGEVQPLDTVAESTVIDELIVSNDELKIKALESIEIQHAKRAAELLADKELLATMPVVTAPVEELPAEETPQVEEPTE